MRSPANGTLYLATAGHCVEGNPLGTQVAVGFDGADPRHMAIIRYISQLSDPSVDQGSCTGEFLGIPDERRCFNDLALLELDAGSIADANASLPQWGGPMAGDSSVSVSDNVYTVGASSRRGGTAPDARSGTAVEVGAWSVRVQFSTTTPPGDSGSPVLDADGHAFGLVIVREPNPPDPVVGTTIVGRLDRMLEAAAEFGWVVEVIPGGPFNPAPVPPSS